MPAAALLEGPGQYENTPQLSLYQESWLQPEIKRPKFKEMREPWKTQHDF